LFSEHKEEKLAFSAGLENLEVDVEVDVNLEVEG